jgi:hypothetical protein
MSHAESENLSHVDLLPLRFVVARSYRRTLGSTLMAIGTFVKRTPTRMGRLGPLAQGAGSDHTPCIDYRKTLEQERACGLEPTTGRRISPDWAAPPLHQDTQPSIGEHEHGHTNMSALTHVPACPLRRMSRPYTRSCRPPDTEGEL